MARRIYLVTDLQTKKERLVWGSHPSKVIQFVAAQQFEVVAAKVTEVARLMKAGGIVEGEVEGDLFAEPANV